ncbi:hypothetical protein llap_11618 [Limosa lapponica baueri]|uniref:Uncharacterized protein n=1 Tax=Limosa lapponica baueri TaxID=1758121 RepID=A0A2I0TWB9_LIMLA|nr:hypothetical protein llap_11618 [Limosa lapponica baueri]
MAARDSEMTNRIQCRNPTILKRMPIQMETLNVLCGNSTELHSSFQKDEKKALKKVRIGGSKHLKHFGIKYIYIKKKKRKKRMQKHILMGTVFERYEKVCERRDREEKRREEKRREEKRREEKRREEKRRERKKRDQCILIGRSSIIWTQSSARKEGKPLTETANLFCHILARS